MNDDITTALGDVPAPDEATKQAARARLLSEARNLQPNPNGHRPTRERILENAQTNTARRLPLGMVGAAAALIVIIGVAVVAATLAGVGGVGAQPVPTPAPLTDDEMRRDPTYLRLHPAFADTAAGYPATVFSAGWLPEGVTFDHATYEDTNTSIITAYTCNDATLTVWQTLGSDPSADPRARSFAPLEPEPLTIRGVEGQIAPFDDGLYLTWEESGQTFVVTAREMSACDLTQYEFLPFAENLRPWSEAQIAAEFAQQIQPEGVEMAEITTLPQGFLPMVPSSIPDETAPGIGQHWVCGDVNLTYQQNRLAGDMLPLDHPDALTSSPPFAPVTIRGGQAAYLAEGVIVGSTPTETGHQAAWSTEAYGIELVWDEAGYRHRLGVELPDTLTAPRATQCALTAEDVIGVAEGLSLP